MDAKAVRAFINEHPDGVEIRMIDGTVYRAPHRDYLWFTPSYGELGARVGRLSTSFWLHDPEKEETRLINVLLVKEVVPLHRNGNGSQQRKRRGGRK